MARFSPALRQMMRSTLMRYGLAVSCVVAAWFVTELLQDLVNGPPWTIFLATSMISSWVAGLGPGLSAGLLSILAIDYFFVPPLREFSLKIAYLPHLVVFGLSALFISWLSDRRKRAEAALRHARDELEARVQERTAELTRTNEQLQAEIAERTRAEAALREQASLLNLTHDTVFVRDVNDVITYWNRGAEELYGWTREQAVGQVTHQLMQTIFPAPLEEINAELLHTGRWEGEIVHTKRDGTQVVVASRWSLQRDERGIPSAILETNNDITERRQAEEALRTAQADLAHVNRVMTVGELAASIAHEINQPLAAVVTNGNAGLRWLGRNPPDLDEAREAVRRMIRDGNRASEVIARIRTLMRRAELRKVRLAINDVIAEVIALADSEVSRHKVLLKTDLAAALPPVLADRIQLQQVILNLLLNSVEAMRTVTDRPRALLIRSEPEETAAIRVAVQDAGVGIAPQDLERIFTAFFTTKPHGMGMGLAISRTIIEAHGGRLWAIPNAGPGTTVQFTLPIGEAGTS